MDQETMDVDYDDIYASPTPSLVKSPPKKNLYSTAKKFKIPREPRHHDHITVARRPEKHPQRPAQHGPSNSIRAPSEWDPKAMTGAFAPYNDNSGWVDDPINHKVYMIGGIRPGDNSFEPTSDFYCYDTRTMKWEDLTDVMVFRVPADRYCDTEVERATKPLPRLSQPGCTLWRRGNTSFIFMFGGHDPVSKKPSSLVIIINLKAREWYYEESLVAGAVGLNPRISPSVVAINNHVYIFGGYRSYKADSQACYSYSIAEWTPPSETSLSCWRWQSRDVPYKTPMPPKAVVGQSISVYDGKLIFLAPGRTNAQDKENKLLQFTNKNQFFFRPADQTFQRVTMLGEGPKNIGWCTVFDLQSTMTPIATPSSLSSNASASTPVAFAAPRKQGRPRKHLTTSEGSSQVLLQVPQRPPLFPAIPSIVICAWIARPSTPGGLLELRRTPNEKLEYTPEIWRFVFAPVDECERLNLMVLKKISELGQDIQGVTVTGGRMHLFGSDLTKKSERSKGDSWNIYIDIPEIRLNG